MTTPTPKRRWYHLTSARCFTGLLVVQVFLFLSERLQWFAFNERKGWTVLIAVGVVGLAGVAMLLWGLVCLCFRRRFRFAFRSLLVILVAVSVPLGWFAWEVQKAGRQGKAVEAIQEAGGGVYFDCRTEVNDRWVELPTEPNAPAWLRALPTWLRTAFGSDYFFCEVVRADFVGTELCEEDIRHLNDLSTLDTLILDDRQISDRTLWHLKGMTGLRWLFLDGDQVTDAGIKSLQQALPNCEIRRTTP